MTDSQLGEVDAILEAVGAPPPPTALDMEDARRVLEASFGELAPVAAIARAHQAALADREPDIQFWVRVYIALQEPRRLH